MSIVIRPSLEMKRQAGFDYALLQKKKFPSKRGSKCGKMDKKEAPDAEALTAPAPGVLLIRL